jgi:rare lipoprotein A
MMFYLAIFLVFCGCGSKDITKVTGVCKSCKPYWVRGEYHEPQDYYEYDYYGEASWYGPGFHGKKKANGETFNQNDYTAAHTVLPLPTVVRVTNLKNQKEIDLVVTDRGPFVYGRSIDLSKAAAKKLGCYVKGTAPVRIQSLVLESKALADYIKENGTGGRTWRKVYEEEIAKRFDDEPYEE